jgi:hypothetical protein
MQVAASITAPGQFYHRLNKTALRRKGVYLNSVNWETADFICNNPDCRFIYFGYGNYVSQLEQSKLILDTVVDLLTSYENNSSLTDSHALELFVKIARKARDLKNETSLR